ncbi:hypothetical protein [Pseudonocardia endophytica]|uniref:Septum formation initiator n=1 Tax=Pseudonocardia endophytica TaxID=401976 RepID=A0A4V2PHC6_PSEEN|nr:hypothetical protein [Pseudonocardia endophytica]TCK20126.1 hypothetical protein EV378_4075 [Pseudonocardia endophytica]
MSRPPARTGVLIALWLAAAAGAMLLGLSAVGSIGSGLTGGGSTQPLSAEDVDARLAVAAPPPPARPAGSTGAQTAVVPAGPAGTVLARCSGGAPSVVSVNPAQGFEASGDDDGGARVKLESEEVEVRVTLRCEGGRPTGTAAVEQDD